MTGNAFGIGRWFVQDRPGDELFFSMAIETEFAGFLFQQIPLFRMVPRVTGQAVARLEWFMPEYRTDCRHRVMTGQAQLSGSLLQHDNLVAGMHQVAGGAFILGIRHMSGHSLG